MERLNALFFLEQFIYGGVAERAGPKAACQWYNWMLKMLGQEATDGNSPQP